MTITCATPTPTITPSQTNTSQATALNLGDLCGSQITLDGTVSVGGSLWYTLTGSGPCTITGQLTLTGNPSSTGELGIFLYPHGGSTPINSSASDTFTIADAATFDVQVAAVSGGPFNFALSITSS